MELKEAFVQATIVVKHHLHARDWEHRGGQACYLSCWSEAGQQDRNEDEVTTRWESFLP